MINLEALQLGHSDSQQAASEHSAKPEPMLQNLDLKRNPFPISICFQKSHSSSSRNKATWPIKLLATSLANLITTLVSYRHSSWLLNFIVFQMRRNMAFMSNPTSEVQNSKPFTFSLKVFIFINFQQIKNTTALVNTIYQILSVYQHLLFLCTQEPSRAPRPDRSAITAHPSGTNVNL